MKKETKEKKEKNVKKLILYGDKIALETAKSVLLSHNVNVEIKEEE